MTTPKLKTLLKVTAEVINLFLSSQESDLISNSFMVSPFYDKNDKNTEVISITFDNYELIYEFLEPLATKLSKTNIKWSISRTERQFSLSLYY